jgi:iron(III) transport system substrate-binding protein
MKQGRNLSASELSFEGIWTAAMRQNKFFAQFCFAIYVIVVSGFEAGAASNDQLDKLMAAARKEGVVNFHAPSLIGPEAAQLLGSAFNKKYGLNIKVNYFPSSSFTKDTAKVIGQAALGVAPEWDVMVLTENNHADLAQKKLHLPFDYKLFGIDPKAIQHDGGTLALSHGLVLPAYNTKVVAANDAPKSWEDLLDPKWRDGKLGVSDATYYFSMFAAGPWGETKTTEYVRGLARQRPFLGRLAELSIRLELGEISMAVMLSESTVHTAKSKGAPIAFADKIEPVLVSTTNIGVIKGAPHPNAALLFTAFNLSPEVQDIWEKYRGHTSAFVPGTRTYNFLKGKRVIFMEGQDPKMVDKLANEYSRILGFTR